MKRTSAERTAHTAEELRTVQAQFSDSAPYFPLGRPENRARKEKKLGSVQWEPAEMAKKGGYQLPRDRHCHRGPAGGKNTSCHYLVPGLDETRAHTTMDSTLTGRNNKYFFELEIR